MGKNKDLYESGLKRAYEKKKKGETQSACVRVTHRQT